jgi:hypothetical protein
VYKRQILSPQPEKEPETLILLKRMLEYKQLKKDLISLPNFGILGQVLVSQKRWVPPFWKEQEELLKPG